MENASFVLCDDNFETPERNWLFTQMHDLITVHHPAEIHQAFTSIENALDQGFYVAGAVSYEAAQAFDLPTHAGAGVPLISLGVFAKRARIHASDVEVFLHTGNAFTLRKHHTFTFEEYEQAFQMVQEHLRDGNTYQVNYTFKCLLERTGCLKALYARLRQAQPVAYGALVYLPGVHILSRSPELFFRKEGNRLTTQPMKGTAARSDAPEEDILILQRLQQDPKTRSENMMIVDLLRNDFGRIAQTGSVRVENMMVAQTYSTVHQIVSTISCDIPQKTSVQEIFEALFPCGSVTGAPKKSTMSIIKALESTSRGVYTGAIGYITPQRDMCFNVPIRTLEFNAVGQGSMGIGSGIVAASDMQQEWDECMLKSKFLDMA